MRTEKCESVELALWFVQNHFVFCKKAKQIKILQNNNGKF